MTPTRLVGHPRRAADTSSRLLVVDGDVAARRTVARALPGLAICPVGSAGRALRLVAAERFAAAIVDVSLPDGDGRDLCATLRRRGLTLPILMLSGLGQEADIVRGLEAGADDYVVKPFRPRELAARVRAQLRQHDSSEHAELRVGEHLFRPGERTVARPGQPRPVRLTETEAAVLKCLCRANGRTVSREELLHHVWGRAAGDATRTLQTHISRLRRKVEPHADSPRLLLHEGGGYRLARVGAAAPAGEGRRRDGEARRAVTAAGS